MGEHIGENGCSEHIGENGCSTLHKTFIKMYVDT